MKEIVASITQRGQVTIPVEVQRILGARPRGKIAFRIEGNVVRLAPVRFTIETVYGSVEPISRPEDFEEIGRVAKEEKVQRTVAKMNRQ